MIGWIELLQKLINTKNLRVARKKIYLCFNSEQVYSIDQRKTGTSKMCASSDYARADATFLSQTSEKKSIL